MMKKLITTVSVFLQCAAMSVPAIDARGRNDRNDRGSKPAHSATTSRPSRPSQSSRPERPGNSRNGNNRPDNRPNNRPVLPFAADAVVAVARITAPYFLSHNSELYPRNIKAS